MLVVLGFSMIGVFMYLIMTKRVTPVAALILVPVAFGLAAGSGMGIGDMVIEAVEKLAPTAALLFFAIIYFGIMIDTGLFDPLIRLILKVVGHDPVKVVIGTAVLTSVVSLDGDGSTTFIIVTSALLPVYLRLGMSPVVLTCVAAVANGVLNVVPWGGPTARAAAALHVSPTDIFVPMLPAMAAGIAATIFLAWLLGRSERRRIGRAELPADREARLAREQAEAGVTVSSGDGATTGNGRGRAGGDGHPAVRIAGGSTGGGTRSAVVELDEEERKDIDSVSEDWDRMPEHDEPDFAHHSATATAKRAAARPKLWFNFALTIAVMGFLTLDLLPVPFVFMVAVALALVVNSPRVSEQAEELKAHAGSVVSVVAMVLAAAVLTGVLSGTGMVEAMAQWLVSVIPSGLGPHLATITGLLSMPLTFFMSNDAFYFGVLPVLAETAANYGIEPVEMARAAVTGQPVHMQSPLVPATLLLIALAGVEMGDHHRKAIWRSVAVSLVMLAVGIATTVIPL